MYTNCFICRTQKMDSFDFSPSFGTFFVLLHLETVSPKGKWKNSGTATTAKLGAPTS